MEVFELRDYVISQYREFSTGYTKILAEDINRFLKKEHANQHYWLAPLVQINAQ